MDFTRAWGASSRHRRNGQNPACDEFSASVLEQDQQAGSGMKAPQRNLSVETAIAVMDVSLTVGSKAS